jgi:hypothetical protein
LKRRKGLISKGLELSARESMRRRPNRKQRINEAIKENNSIFKKV